MKEFLKFVHTARDGLEVYTVGVGDDGFPDPEWAGLYRPYPEDRSENPYFRHAINNGDGEALAVWRALAWSLTEGRRRFAIPAYWRDQAAALLGRDRTETVLVAWEYDVDVERADAQIADRGFVPGRTCVPLRPPPDHWERETANRAGIFALDSFDQLTKLALAVGGDVSSEITLFAIAPTRDQGILIDGLNRPDRPTLRDLLGDDDLFVDLSIVHDRFLGHTSYLTIKAIRPIDAHLVELAEHYNRAYDEYLRQLPSVGTMADFHGAVQALLAPGPDQGQ